MIFRPTNKGLVCNINSTKLIAAKQTGSLAYSQPSKSLREQERKEFAPRFSLCMEIVKPRTIIRVRKGEVPYCDFKY